MSSKPGKRMKQTDEYQRREIAVGKFVVREASMREAVRRINMVTQMQDYLKQYPDDLELAQALSPYPFVAGCTQPIISIDQFLEMPEVVLDELSQAAMELNPHWFVMPDQEKKINEPPATSTEDSATS